MNGHSPHATDAHVLAAAAALREFTLNEITAVCDATPSAIVEILATAGNAVPPVGSADPLRWRVRDVTALRRMIRAGRRGDDPPPSPSVLAGDADLSAVRLRHAEDLLARCGAEPSPTRRRSMVIAAVNHLRQVVAEALPDTPPWWTVELTGGRVDDQIRWHGEGAISHRLSFDIVVARLAVGNAAGVIVPTADLIDTVISVRHTVASIDDHCLPALVRGFVELVTAQLAATTTPAVDRLVVAVARRRVRAKVGADPVMAMGELEPMVRALGSAPDRPPVRDLHKTVRQLPDGRDVVVVYADLLPLVPMQYRWQRIGEPLPGALVELVADPSVSEHLGTCASALETDLARSPYGSDRALIGQAAHVFQRLAEQTSGIDGGVILRGNQARSELLDLAMPTLWPPPVAGDDDLGVSKRWPQ
jgi:hypothetical protein